MLSDKLYNYSRLSQNRPDKLVSKVLFQTVFRAGISQPYTCTNKTNFIIYSSGGNLSFKRFEMTMICLTLIFFSYEISVLNRTWP